MEKTQKMKCSKWNYINNSTNTSKFFENKAPTKPYCTGSTGQNNSSILRYKDWPPWNFSTRNIVFVQQIQLIYVFYIILFSSYQSNYGTSMVIAFSYIIFFFTCEDTDLCHVIIIFLITFSQLNTMRDTVVLLISYRYSI